MAGKTIKGRHLLVAKDFVEVVGPDGEDLPSVPKHWGEEQLPPGASFKKKSRGSSSSVHNSSASTAPPTQPPAPDATSTTHRSTPDVPNPDVAPPAGNASTEAWVEWAKTVKGATDDDLKDADGEPLKRDDIKAKYAETPAY